MKLLQHLSPYVRVAMDHWLPLNAYIPERVIWDYELLFVKHGELEVTVEDTLYNGTTGDVFLFKPKQRHSIRVVGQAPVEQPHVHFDLIEDSDSPFIPVSFKPASEMDETELAWFRQDLLSGPELLLPSRIRLRSPKVFEKLLFTIIQEFRARAPFAELRLKGLMLDLLVTLIRDSHWQIRYDEPDRVTQLTSMKDYLNRHSDRTVTLDEMSAHFHMNKRYLIGLFRQAFEQTPIQYHQQMRMEQAKNLLKFTQLSMQEMSEALGYPNLHTFSRAFKNNSGCSPTAYRNAFRHS
ncbi:AraC family transcriptional regulator [Paenibacillus mendelii]|uniref:Helix-turn-helix domain-containing protein n=1 Tax=Paenibacillus mendelii TaxID=206163 RepID=A0ABV6JGQ2_9BACL|nr:AraC family transcriptional regulator [Paenibacillus mendelii]MCQ6557975.1 AraC family transcriptional regulator [Paenibacillus mendelii]